MNSGRSQALLASLERELSTITSRAELNSLGRRRWLLNQLDNYLDRWMGFAAIGIEFKSLLRDDLFLMLLAGVHVYTQEMEGSQQTGAEREAWQKFLNRLQELRETRNPALLAVLRDTLTDVREANFLKTS